MLMEHTYEIKFARELVPQPIVCEMARQFRDVMFNIDHLSVSKHDALMRISVVGQGASLQKAEKFLLSTRAQVRSVGSRPFAGDFPNVPVRTLAVPPGESPIHRKIWLTIIGSLRRYPLFWVLSRRYDITFNIHQSAVGDPVSILCLTLWGLATEIEGAVRFLREQGVDVEYGDISTLA